MPDPTLAFGAVKFLWEESRSVRSSLWRKLPFAKDSAKKAFAEKELGRLLDDANGLSKSVMPEHLDEAIEKRLEVFSQALVGAKIPGDQVAVLVDRASIFVKIMITEPYSETATLRMRIAELEKAVQGLEARSEEYRLRFETAEAAIRSARQDKSVLALWVGVGVLTLLEAVQLLYVLLHSSGSSH